MRGTGWWTLCLPALPSNVLHVPLLPFHQVLANHIFKDGETSSSKKKSRKQDSEDEEDEEDESEREDEASDAEGEEDDDDEDGGRRSSRKRKPVEKKATKAKKGAKEPGSRAGTGFGKPIPLSAALKELVGQDAMNRGELSKW